MVRTQNFKRFHNKKSLISLFALLFLYFSNSPALANIQCSSLLGTQHEVITTSFRESTSRSTVEIEQEINGPHGGKLFVIRKSGETWVSQFTTFKFDLQGDPRWFIGAVGEDIAAFFGFRIIDSTTMTIPDASEFQFAMDKINSTLVTDGKEPVLIRFKTDDLTEAPMQGYIDTFRAFELPLASNGNHLVHDMSFHTGTIFIPNRIIKAAQSKVSFTIDFMTFLQKQEHEHSDLIASIKKYVKTLLVRSIDNGTGFGNLAMIALKAEDSFVENQITELVSKMHDSDAEGDPAHVSILSPVHLSLGTASTIKHYNNPRFEYTPPTPGQNGLRLKNYTIDMLLQFLDTAIDIEYEKQQRYSGRPNFPILRSFNPKALKSEVQNFLKAEMEAFSQTPEGVDSNFNLLTVFDKNISMKGSQQGFEVTSETADNLAAEFMGRALEIENAARTYIEHTGFTAPLLLTNLLNSDSE